MPNLKLSPPFVIAALVAILLCRAEPTHAQDFKLPFKSVAVVTTLGDDLSIKRFGYAIFDSSEFTIDIQDWGIDELIEDGIVKDLSPYAPAYAVRVDAKAFNAISHGLFGADVSKLLAAIRRQPGVPDVDAFLIVTPGEVQPIVNRTFTARGLTLAYEKHPVYENSTKEYAAFDILLLDRSGKTIYTFVGGNPGDAMFRANFDVNVPDNAGSLSADDVSKLKAAFRDFAATLAEPILMRPYLLPSAFPSPTSPQ